MRSYLPAAKALSSPKPGRLEKVMEPLLSDIKFKDVPKSTRTRLKSIEESLESLDSRSEGHIEIYREYNKNLYETLEELRDKTIIYEEAISRDRDGKSYLGTDPFDDNNLLAVKHKRQFEQIRDEESNLNSGPLVEDLFTSKEDLDEFHKLDEVIFFPLAPFPIPYKLIEETQKGEEGYVRKFIRKPALWEPIEKTNQKLESEGKWILEDFHDKEKFPSGKKGKYKFSESLFDKKIAKKLDMDQEFSGEELREYTFYNRQIFKEAYRNIHKRISSNDTIPIYSRKAYFAYDLIMQIYDDMKEEVGEYHEMDNMRNEDRPLEGICEDSAFSILTNYIKSEVGLKPE